MRLIGLISMVLVLASCKAWAPLTTEVLVPEETIERIKAEKAAAAAVEERARTRHQKKTFGILADFVGNTYHGKPSGNSEDAVADFQQWEWADEDEPVLLIRHSLSDGSYGGDTLVRRDPSSGQLTYVYTTTAGFVTRGAFDVSDAGTWEAVEDVEGHADITQVRSKGHVRSDGALISSSEYLKNGRWVTGHSFVYRQTDKTLEELLASSKRFGWLPGR